ncbi:MAG: 1,4-alpha-glucan branching protein GlgB [Burkholderiaceae bacterium]
MDSGQYRRDSEAGLAVLDEQDVFLFREGTHTRLAEKMGARLLAGGGAHFAVWAPNARSVSVIGEWNGWQPHTDPLQSRSDGSGIWEGVVRQATHGAIYKYRIDGRDGSAMDKADPYALLAQLPPATGSRLWSLDYEWHDADWMQSQQCNAVHKPISVYELHAGSWKRDRGEFMDYRALAHALGDYLAALGFTHVELMPLTEHPFYGSWGYQCTGYFAPTARYGTPQDFMYFIDHLHSRGIGVILDWVPSHFPADAHGLQHFDGTHLYEHADPRQGFHPEWNSSIFNYGRNEVRSFLLSSALHWLRNYHIDGLRVDAVASMLYLDYARKDGEWIPNRYGGRENLEAVEFLRVFNQAIAREHPHALSIAEESTAWPGVSRPVASGGLGFGMKWNMGWMHDTLAYFAHDPVHRKYHQQQLAFSMVYAFHENFMLPLSHDEVVYGKGALLSKMPGDDWQQFANLRALYGYMWAHPGKKLLFMGSEFAQRREWRHEGELDWSVADAPAHAGVWRLVADLNALYRRESALHAGDFASEGFEWVALDDADASVFAFLRKAPQSGAVLLVVCNLTPVVHHGYRLGVPRPGQWTEALNSDALEYGGSGVGNFGAVQADPIGSHGRPYSVQLSLPPLATLVFRHQNEFHDT